MASADDEPEMNGGNGILDDHDSDFASSSDEDGDGVRDFPWMRVRENPRIRVGADFQADIPALAPGSEADATGANDNRPAGTTGAQEYEAAAAAAAAGTSAGPTALASPGSDGKRPAASQASAAPPAKKAP